MSSTHSRLRPCRQLAAAVLGLLAAACGPAVATFAPIPVLLATPSCQPHEHVSAGRCCGPGEVSSPDRSACTCRAPRVCGAMTELAAARDAPMLTIPGGTFWMGSPEGVGESDEHPEIEVTVQAFELDPTEVTVAAYRECFETALCTRPASGTEHNGCNWTMPERDQHPINCVSWTQADRYCRAIGRRLPTEAEWEYAARGTDRRTYPWGSTYPTYARARWSGPHVYLLTRVDLVRSTTAVGSYPEGVSPFGAMDMAGNVSEWTASSWRSYDPAAPDFSGWDPVDYHMVRGGGWDDWSESRLRAAARFVGRPDRAARGVGFRCARGGTVEPAAPEEP